MGLPKFDATEPKKNTRQWWIGEILDAWQKTAVSLVATGKRLVEAKAALPKGEWIRMVNSDLPFSYKTAQMLMKIASDQKIAENIKTNKLPVSVRSLYEITKLEPRQFRDAIKVGRINPEMNQFDAMSLCRKASAQEILDRHQKNAIGRNKYKEHATGGGILDGHETELSKPVGDCTKDELAALVTRSKIRAEFYRLLVMSVTSGRLCRDCLTATEAEAIWKMATKDVEKRK